MKDGKILANSFVLLEAEQSKNVRKMMLVFFHYKANEVRTIALYSWTAYD